MILRRLHRAIAVAALVVTGCSGEEPEPIPEACEHLAGSSSIGVSNGGTVAADHRRYDVSLQPGRNPSATVLFQVPSDGRWFIYENKNVPVRARRNGVEVPVVATAIGTAQGACSATGIRTEMQLEVGTYELSFAETFETLVSVVIESKANVP